MAKDINAPPCVKLGEPMNWCAKRQMAERLLGHFALVNEWAGWRFAGRELVSPEGLRINPERLRGILHAEKQKAVTRGQFAQETAQSARIISLEFADKVRTQQHNED